MITPVPSKSRTLRVTKAIPLERAIAAICASAVSIGRPAFCLDPAMRAYSSAALLSKGIILSRNSSSKVLSISAVSVDFLLPDGRISMLYRSSASLTAERNRCVESQLSTHVSTELCGVFLMSSDTMFVSSRYIFDVLIESRWIASRSTWWKF